MDKQREEFEKWYFDAYKDTDLGFLLPNGQYSSLRKQHSWDSWNASTQRQGFKFVPIEPSKEMLDEFPEVIYQDTYAGECSVLVDDETIRLGYKAMIGEETK